MIFASLSRRFICYAPQIALSLRGKTHYSMSAARDALAEATTEGKFDRVPSAFRDIISTEHDRYQPEFQRYHLYISLACPWANRCLVILKLKGN